MFYLSYFNIIKFMKLFLRLLTKIPDCKYFEGYFTFTTCLLSTVRKVLVFVKNRPSFHGNQLFWPNNKQELIADGLLSCRYVSGDRG